jgi:hypothetical protein
MPRERAPTHFWSLWLAYAWKPELRGFGVPALAGAAVALSSALKSFEVILFANAAPPEGETPNLHPLVELGLQFAEAGERRWTSVYQVRDFELWPGACSTQSSE